MKVNLWTNENYNEGEMEKGNIYGLGKFTPKNGKIYEERFIDGKFQGKNNFLNIMTCKLKSN
ncbi:MAG: hypothetical protein IKO49_05125 [Bacilli bacterium]|nr:hypothetical protein [Bacilli bacterium]